MFASQARSASCFNSAAGKHLVANKSSNDATGARTLGFMFRHPADTKDHFIYHSNLARRDDVLLPENPCFFFASPLRGMPYMWGKSSATMNQAHEQHHHNRQQGYAYGAAPQLRMLWKQECARSHFETKVY